MYVRHNLSHGWLLIQEIACLLLLLLCPTYLWFYWISYSFFDPSPLAAASALWSEMSPKFFFSRLPEVKVNCFVFYGAWLSLPRFFSCCCLGQLLSALARLKERDTRISSTD